MGDRLNAVEKLEAAIEVLVEMRGPLRESADRWEVYDDLGIWAIRSSSGTAIGIDFMEEDAVEIVALRRTIDAQVRVLRQALDWHAEEYVSYIGPAEIALADAILGDSA